MTTNYDMNDMVRKKLMKQLQGDPLQDDPYDDYAKAAIEAGAMQGIAGGMAQLGTVHGKTPDPTPYMRASQQMLAPLEKSAMNLQSRSKLDPSILTYLSKKQAATPGYKPLSNPLEGNKQGFYNPNDPSDIVTGPKLYDKPAGPKDQPYQTEVDKTAGKNFGENQTLLLNNDESIARLERVITNLEKSPERSAFSRGVSGVVAGSALEGAIQPEVKEISKQLAEEILKLADSMKGALSDSDLKLLKTTMYDPSLPNSANLATLKPMLGKVKRAQAELRARQDYLTRNGTLKGYQPNAGDAPSGGLSAEEKKELEIRRAKLKGGAQK